MEMDFGYGGDKTPDNGGTPNANGDGAGSTDLGTGKVNAQQVGAPDADELGDPPSSGGSSNGDGGTSPATPPAGDGNGGQQDPPAGDDNSDLQPGTSLEVEGVTYTVDKDGNVVAEDGTVFKEAKDVKTWLQSFESVEDADDSTISINSVQAAIGIQILDDDDKPVEFENTPDGIRAYVEAVNDARKADYQEAAINTLYQKYPIINDVLNYYIANGNSLDGFNEVPDRTNIVFDETNEAQHENIIRTAWSEQNRRGDVEAYIQYLKSSGTMSAVAQQELDGIKESDKQYFAELERQAEEAEQAQIKSLEKYWNGVKETVDSRVIAGYQIPDTIVISKDGQRVSVTPNDFFNYIYQTDKEGKSAYERELAKETPESRREDELLRAYLKFTGGSYASLVGMAVNKSKVETLKFKAKNKPTSSVKITKPVAAPGKTGDIDVGYN